MHSFNMFSAETRRKHIQNAHSLGLKNLIELEGAETGNKSVVIGGGPSVNEKKSLIHTLSLLSKHKVVSIERMLPWCIKNDVFPDYVVAIDGHEDVVESFTEMPKTRYVLNSQCHPAVFEHLKDQEIYIFNSHNEDLKNEDFISWGDKEGAQVNTGSTVVLGCISISMLLGMRNFDVFGFDCHITEAEYAAGIGGKGGIAERIKVRIEGRDFLTTVAYMGFAQQFFIMRQFGKDLGLWGSCTIHGDSLVNALGRYEGASKGSH